MKIAIFSSELAGMGLPHGGLGTFTSNLANALMQEGHYVEIFLITQSTASEVNAFQCDVHLIKKINLPKINAPLYKTFRSVLSCLATSFRAARDFKARHQKICFDVIHTSDMYGPALFLSELLIPTVCRTSFYLPAWRAAYGFRQGLAERLEDWLSFEQMKRATLRISPSQKQAEIYREIEGLDCRVIRSPRDICATIGHQDPINEFWDKDYVFFFGAIGRLKGIDLVIEIIHDLLRDNPRLYFVLCGPVVSFPDGTSPVDALEKAAGGFNDRIIYLGRRSASYVTSLCRMSKAVLIPSRIDNYPNACIEALAAQAVVVGSDNSSIEEIIQDGVNGFLFKNGNSIEMLKVLQAAIGLSDKKRRKLTLEALASVQGQNQSQAIARQFISTYKDAIKLCYASLP